MIICEVLFYIIFGSKTFSYSIQATRTQIQDPNISNFESLIWVDRYFITDNQSPTFDTVNTGGRASYQIAQLAGTCFLTSSQTSLVQLFQTQSDAKRYLFIISGWFPILSIFFTIMLMICFWVAGFILAPSINYSHIPPFLRRGTKLQSLHGLILINFVCMILIDGTLMPLHFINLDQLCIISTNSHISAQSTLRNFFTMQILLWFTSFPLCIIMGCRKISQILTLIAMVILYVSMLFVVYLAFVSYYFLWLVGLQSYSIVQSTIFLVAVSIPLVYMLIVLLYLVLIIKRKFVKCVKKRK